MELIRGLHNIRERHKGCVLTIGKFDGVHLGHQAVLASLVSKARMLNLPATVMVFEPQPEEVFTPLAAPARLSRLRDKFNQLKQLGVDRLLCIKFDEKFASYTASAFVEDLLVKQLGIQFLAVGDDFRFGKGRTGDFSTLIDAGRQYAFDVASTQSFRLKECRISSTEIRQALAQDDFAKANEMLGRPFDINGKVVHGDAKGRTIGFPTANVLLKRCIAPVNGVFSARVIVDGKVYKGVCNIGSRPTVNGKRSQLEVHLFNFSGDLYGQFISVQLHTKLRNEKRFDSFEQLKQQIDVDAQQARALLSED